MKSKAQTQLTHQLQIIYDLLVTEERITNIQIKRSYCLVYTDTSFKDVDADVLVKQFPDGSLEFSIRWTGKIPLDHEHAAKAAKELLDLTNGYGIKARPEERLGRIAEGEFDASSLPYTIYGISEKMSDPSGSNPTIVRRNFDAVRNSLRDFQDLHYADYHKKLIGWGLSAYQ